MIALSIAMINGFKMTSSPRDIAHWRPKRSNALGRRSQFACLLFVVSLLSTLVSLTMLAKIVTYTPIPVSSAVQYGSHVGRRVVFKERQQIDLQTNVSQAPGYLEIALPNNVFIWSEEPAGIFISVTASYPVPLRSPPARNMLIEPNSLGRFECRPIEAA